MIIAIKIAILFEKVILRCIVMQKQYSIADAKNKLPSIIHQVEEGPYVKLTRRGKPVAVLLSIGEFERLNISNSGFWNALMAF